MEQAWRWFGPKDPIGLAHVREEHRRAPDSFIFEPRHDDRVVGRNVEVALVPQIRSADRRGNCDNATDDFIS